MIPKKLLGSSKLLRSFYIHETIEIILVNMNKKLIFINFQMILPGFKIFNNGQNLIIINFILRLSFEKYAISIETLEIKFL